MHCLVDGLRTLTILPGEVRIARIAARASRYLVSRPRHPPPRRRALRRDLSPPRPGPGLGAGGPVPAAAGPGRAHARGPGPPAHAPPAKTAAAGGAAQRRPAARFEGPAMRFAYAMRDELIVADARILQAQCEELRNAPPETEEALRRHILRIGKPYRSEPAPDPSGATSPARRCRAISPSARCACGRRRSAACSAPRPSSTSSSRSRSRRARAASTRPRPSSTPGAATRPTPAAPTPEQLHRPSRLQPPRPRPARRPLPGRNRVGRLQARPQTAARQRRLPGHHRLQPPRPATLVTPPSAFRAAA